MAAKPKKTVLAEDIVERLKAVGTGGGYFTNLGRRAGIYVGRRVKVLALMEDGEFPSAAVLMGGGKPSEEMQAGMRREDAQVAVLLYGKAADIPAELERLEADAKRAVLTLPNLTGAHGRARHVETTPYYNEQEQTDRGLVMVTFAAPFNWTDDSP